MVHVKFPSYSRDVKQNWPNSNATNPYPVNPEIFARETRKAACCHKFLYLQYFSKLIYVSCCRLNKIFLSYLLCMMSPSHITTSDGIILVWVVYVTACVSHWYYRFLIICDTGSSNNSSNISEVLPSTLLFTKLSDVFVISPEPNT